MYALSSLVTCGFYYLLYTAWYVQLNENNYTNCKCNSTTVYTSKMFIQSTDMAAYL